MYVSLFQTSALALMSVVSVCSPTPHESWVFHNKSVGGLWLSPLDAAQIYKSQYLQKKKKWH